VLSEEDLEAVFSVIPEIDARQARAQLSERLSVQLRPMSGAIGWIDFDRSFQVERAGVTDFGGLASRLIFAPENHDLLSGLIKTQRDNDIKPGTLIMSPDHERLYWFVPLVGEIGGGLASSTIRGLSIGPDVFARFVEGFNPDAALTPSEQKVVFHIVGGLTLHQSAERDGLALETRRGQMKRLCAKLDVSGQHALIRLVLSQAVHLLFLVDHESKHTRAAEAFAAAHLPPSVRLETRRLSTGRLMRVFEAGPSDGTPVVVFHGLFFPTLLHALAGGLEDAGIRLIMPLRPGYLVGETDPTIGADRDAVRLMLPDFASYMDEVLGHPTVVIGHSMGCVAALNFANAYPKWVKHLSLMSPYLGREAEGAQGYIGRILRTLARFPHNAAVFRLVAQQFARSYRKRATVRSALSSVFGASTSDMRVLNGEAGLAPVETWFSEAFTASSNGIGEDFRSVVRLKDPDLSSLKCPISMFWGDEDPLNPASLRSVTDKFETEVIEGAGHFAVVVASDSSLERLKTLSRTPRASSGKVH
jgi:pimeloyl-ACP methyl ester carboxylesterase/DNA-binding CsgD family transcriptional regulator